MKRSGHDNKETHGDVWLKASVMGGLWASVEIVAGSFLHNLRIPFAGSLLTLLAIVLLTSFHKMWPLRGLILRAGMICALMKSISPSSVILGPMSGIFFEALLLEAGVFIMGRNFAGYWLGGVLAMLSSLVHKVLSLLILDGFDIVNIYRNIYLFLPRQVQADNPDPWAIVWGFVIVYALAGFLAAHIGMVIGNKALNHRSGRPIPDPGEKQYENLFLADEKRKYNYLLLILHFLAIPGGLFVIGHELTWLLGFLAFYLAFCIYYYHKSLRRLKKPVFWIQLMVILLLALAFGVSGTNDDGFFGMEGLIAGLEMDLRAVFIVVSFSALSVELRNPLVKKLFLEGRFKNLYLSLELSFGILPELIKVLPPAVLLLRHPVVYFSIVIEHANIWFTELSGKVIFSNSK